MKRTLVQLDDETYRKLRKQAFRQERSVSSLVREFVANGLAGPTTRSRPSRVTQFASVGAGRSGRRGVSRISENHDEALVAAFEK